MVSISQYKLLSFATFDIFTVDLSMSYMISKAIQIFSFTLYKCNTSFNIFTKRNTQISSININISPLQNQTRLLKFCTYFLWHKLNKFLQQILVNMDMQKWIPVFILNPWWSRFRIMFSSFLIDQVYFWVFTLVISWHVIRN